MNARPLPPSCRVCGGHGDVCDDGRWRSCRACSGTGEAGKPIRWGLVGIACLIAATAGSLIPCGWWAA